MSATLFAVPASHPSLAAQLMLEHKGIEFRRVDLVSAVHRGLVRALGFEGKTVPALRIEGARLQGTRRIALALDALQPDPPLVPRDPDLRERVLRAERWGDEVLQPVPRRLVWAALKRDRSTLGTYLEGSNTGIPTGLAVRTSGPIVWLAARLNQASEQAVRSDLRALPSLLDRVDGLLEDGTIGRPERNVADFQIATSVALLLTMEDLRPKLEGRPAAAHARAVAPDYPGHTGATFPPGWL
ncbi:MAG TPA: glutathione S-transferase N-terminal domain-containing protein [Thermoleophilaceae bacterium]|nr:glutathione S-transferase N-terminal domain-containing protein [Thermoleophilaceae bacterium]